MVRRLLLLLLATSRPASRDDLWRVSWLLRPWIAAPREGEVPWAAAAAAAARGDDADDVVNTSTEQSVVFLDATKLLYILPAGKQRQAHDQRNPQTENVKQSLYLL